MLTEPILVRRLVDVVKLILFGLLSELASCHCLDCGFSLLVEIAHSVLKGDTQVLKRNVSLLGRVNIIPNFSYIFSCKRNAHALHCRDKVRLAHLSLASLVHESEDVCDISVLLFHAAEHEGHQLFHVLELHLRIGLTGRSWSLRPHRRRLCSLL